MTAVTIVPPVPALAATYTNTTSHWAWGFNGEGNNGPKDAFWLAGKSYSVNSGSRVTLDSSYYVRIPNGYHAWNGCHTSDLSSNGAWTGYNLPYTFTQPQKGLAIEFDYSPNVYSISYNLNGGKQAAGQPTSYNVLYGVTLKNPTRTGYQFAGWSEGSALTNVHSNGAYTMAAPYNAAARDHTNLGISLDVTSGKTYHVVCLAKRTKGDRGLQGGLWYTARTSGASYDGYSAFTKLYDLSDGWGLYYRDVTVPAGKTKANFYIQIEQSASTGYDTAWQIASPYVAEGSITTGINQGANASFSSADDLYNKLAARQTGNVSLVANWVGNPYTVHFDANGGSGSMNPQTINMDQSTKLSANKLTRTGYRFTGWNTQANGKGKAYSDQQAVTNLTETADGTVTLYAQWKAHHYSIRFDPNGAPGSMEDQAMEYGTAAPLDACTLSWPGHTFTGWNTGADGSGTAYADGAEASDLPADDGATVTLYAQWVTDAYRISYNLGGAGDPGNPSSYDAESAAITLKAPARDGYEFCGWTGTGLSEPAMEVTIPAGSTGDRSYVATWEKISYPITYDLAGGMDPGNPASYDVETGTFVLKAPMRAGWTFAGWTGTGLDAPAAAPSIAQGSTGDRSYVATWSPNSVTVTFDGNGGTVAHDAEQEFTAGKGQNFADTGASRPGWIFLGWADSKDAAAPDYSADQAVTDAWIGDGETRTVYAVWKQEAYTVTVPTKISHSGMDVGKVDVSDSYGVTVKGEVGTSSVEVTATVEQQPGGGLALSVAQGKSVWTPAEVNAGTTSTDTARCTGTVKDAGPHEGTIAYTSRLTGEG